MADSPWLGDACSLVDAFRKREISPVEALDAVLAAIEASQLNAFSYLDVDYARATAAAADTSLPFGGVPIGVKELDRVKGWPATEASLVLKDNVSDYTSTYVDRLRDAGAVTVGLTTASEFGGVNHTRTRLNGITHNPWDTTRTPGGSSGGSAAAVAGGLVPIATAGDGGGSIRIPAGFCGLVGLKNTYGRIPKGPGMTVQPLTSVKGCVSRSVRDTARWLDVTNGFHPRDPYSLPRVEGWETGLGTHDLAGKRVAIVPNMGNAVVLPEVEAMVRQAAEELVKHAGLTLVDVDLEFPEGSVPWAMAGLVGVLVDVEGRYPEVADLLTPPIAFGMKLATEHYDLKQAAAVETYRTTVNEKMADLFEQVDFVMGATNPDVAFDAAGPLPTRVGDREVGVGNNGALTIPANTAGNPALTVPIGTIDGRPIGLQIMGPHHREAELLDLGLVMERERPWPLVAPGAPL